MDDCPGLWYGNTPNAYGKGNVTVETEKVVEAIDWLRKQRVTILETGPPAGRYSGGTAAWPCGLWKRGAGLTPEATLSSKIMTEIRDKGKDARFKKVKPGHWVGVK